MNGKRQIVIGKNSRTQELENSRTQEFKDVAMLTSAETVGSS
jgi:hypothetical protein